MDEKIKDCLQTIKGSSFSYEQNLISGDLLSSFDVFELIICLEEKFDIKFSLENIQPENFESIETIRTLILKTRQN